VTDRRRDVSSTVYGQVIIILVYVPLLAFHGRRRPDVRTDGADVMIALAPRFVVSLTFVPAAIAIAVSKPVRETRTWPCAG